MRPAWFSKPASVRGAPGSSSRLEQHVADHPPLARDRLERQEADARHVLAVEAAVAAAEQLVAAAHGEERGATAEHGLLQRLRLRGEVLGHEQLLAVLAAADVVEVVRAGDDRVVHAERGHVELVPAPGRAAREHGDVAAVGIDVEVVRDRGGRRGSSSCGALPVGLCEAALGDDALQREHRGVGRQDDELAAVGRQFEAAVERRSRSGSTTICASSRPPYLKRSASSAARSPVATSVCETVEQRLEVDVPDPRDVAAVGDRVVQRDDGDAWRAAVDERAHGLVRAGGILDQEQQQPLAVPTGIRSNRPNAALKRAEAGRDLVERRAERPGERGGAERVVDVVEAGQRELDRGACPRA